MSAADCSICEMSGYRTCDVCDSTPVFHPVPGTEDVCGYCAADREAAAARA